MHFKKHDTSAITQMSSKVSMVEGRNDLNLRSGAMQP